MAEPINISNMNKENLSNSHHAKEDACSSPILPRYNSNGCRDDENNANADDRNAIHVQDNKKILEAEDNIVFEEENNDNDDRATTGTEINTRPSLNRGISIIGIPCSSEEDSSTPVNIGNYICKRRVDL